MSFDEFAVESLESVGRHDPSGLLFALATAGAQVRSAARSAAEAFAAAGLTDAGPARAILVATDSDSSVLVGVLRALGGAALPVVGWSAPTLPRWAGAADALIVAAHDGRHPRLAELIAQADRRGLTAVVIGAADSPVARAGRAVHVGVGGAHPRVRRWTLLTPAVSAAVALGAVAADAAPWEAVADALDGVAEAARPDSDPFASTAKQLAIALAESSPIVAGAGPLAYLAAVSMVRSLGVFAATSAVALRLPDDMAWAGALVAAGPDAAGTTDFFADRVDAGQRRPRLVLIGDDGGPRAEPGPSPADGPLGDLAGVRAAAALYDIAAAGAVPASGVDVPDGPGLVRFAAASAFGDFVAAYLAIGLGIDPGATRPGELPH